MPVAPVKGVHREEGRNDAECLEGLDLIQARGLSVNRDRTPIGLSVLLLGEFDRSDELVDGGVAIDMREQLPAILEREVDISIGLIVLELGIAAIVGRLAVGRLEIGLGQPGGLALG